MNRQTALQLVRGIGMAQAVQPTDLGDAGGTLGQGIDPLDLPRLQVPLRMVRVGKESVGGAIARPVAAKLIHQDRTHRHQPVFGALALLDAEPAALTIDMLYLQRHDLAAP